MNELAKFVTFAYLFESSPVPDSRVSVWLSALFGLSVLLSVLVWFWLVIKERENKLFIALRRRFVAYLFTFGFVGLILIFFRWQEIPVLAARFWILAWVITGLVWLGLILRYLLKEWPKERTIDQEARLKEKYLPRNRQSLSA